MGRHSRRISPARRLAGILAGTFTVVLLLVTIWALGRPGADSADLLAAPETSAISPTTATTVTPPTTATTVTSPTTSLTSPTFTSATATVTSPTVTAATIPPLVMEPNGLGAVDLGAPADEAITAVNERLGPATSDTGWVSARGSLGTCPGTVAREVRWESLRLYFSDGPTEFGDGAHHLFYYSQSTVDTETIVPLSTPSGIGLNSNLAALREAYADRLTIDSSIRLGITYTVESVRPGLLSGTLSSSSDDGAVTSISGGFGCGA